MACSKAPAKSITKLSPTEPFGKSVRSAEGLQIAEPETYPEAVNRYSPTRDTKLPQLQDQSSPDEASICTRLSQERISFRLDPGSDQSRYGTTLEVPPDLVKKFFKHRRRKFVFIIAFTLFVLGVLIAASIGGSLYLQDKALKAAADAARMDQTLALNNTVTSVESPDASEDSSGTYTARPFGAVQSINTTCPSTILVSSQLEGKKSNISGHYIYSCLDNTNILEGFDLLAFTSYTLEQCVDACSQYNAMSNKKETCKAVVINSQFRQSYETGYGANCWLKGTAQGAVSGKTEYTAAILHEQ